MSSLQVKAGGGLDFEAAFSVMYVLCVHCFAQIE